MDLIEKETVEQKFYSAKSIAMATFLGTPLVGGYLMSENYKVLGKPTERIYAIVIGLLATVSLFVGVFMISEAILENIPSQLLPLIYAGITLGIVQWQQGDILKKHLAEEKPFYSGWRAAGIAIISAVLITLVLLAYLFLFIDNEAYEAYDTKFEVFQKNENESLLFYDHLETETNIVLIRELENDVIPKWEENIEIIKASNLTEDLPSDLKTQNTHLLTYCELRIKAFKIFEQALKEDSDLYFAEIEDVHKEIEAVLVKLNAE